MTAPADVLVQEIVADNLLGEEVLLVMEKTAQRLLRPGAVVIPSLGKVRVALAQDKGAGDLRMGTVYGFDLSAFNLLAKPTYSLPVGSDRLSLCSEPADLFAFDFRSGGPFPAASARVILTAHGGPVNGIAQWIALEMDENDRYENRPCLGSKSAWAVRFTPLSRPRDWPPGRYSSPYTAPTIEYPCAYGERLFKPARPPEENFPDALGLSTARARTEHQILIWLSHDMWSPEWARRCGPS